MTSAIYVEILAQKVKMVCDVKREKTMSGFPRIRKIENVYF